MPSTPTTKSQVQAYKFVLRRMQSALVRKDAVMLHDPMRTHSRATIVGVLLGAVGLVGFLIFGLLSPAPTLPGSGIVISKESGTVYVLTSNPRTLIPTFNLASARLLLLAQQQQQSSAGGQQQATPAAPAAGSSAPAQPTIVSDKDLQGVPKGRLMGIRDGPQLLPDGDERPDNTWAVCDAYQLDNTLPDPASENKVETTVLAGVRDLGTPLVEGGDNPTALLVQADNNKTYLVYHLSTNPNLPNTDTVRAQVDLNNRGVTSALHLDRLQPRKITTGLLNAIPEVTALAAPHIDGQGTPSNLIQGKDFQVGSVFQVQTAGAVEYYVVEQDGIQNIKETTANLIRSSLETQGDEQLPVVPQVDVSAPPHVHHIDEENIPSRVPTVLETTKFPVTCLGWSIAPGQSEGHTAVFVDNQDQGVPLPKNLPPSYKGVAITTPTPDTLKIDHFYMTPGKAAVVRGASSKNDYATGPIYLVSDRGVKFGVPDTATASALGLMNPEPVPAPYPIVSLLPNGASLNTRDVLQSYDTVPVGPGVYETPSASAQPGAPGGQAGG